jgi:subfamily B ATP-binding cassette protein MsbA
MSLLIRFFREHLKPFLPMIVGGTILLALAGVCQGLQIGIIRLVFDENSLANLVPVHYVGEAGVVMKAKIWLVTHLPSMSELRQAVYPIPLILMLAFLLKGIFTYIGTMLVVYSGVKATISLRERLFSHILKQELDYFYRNPVGELLQRCIGDVNAVQGIASNQLADAIREVAIALAMMVTILIMNWRLSIALFVVGPIMVWLIKQLSQRIRSINHRNMEASGRLLQRLKEVFSNIRVVFSFVRESFGEKLFHQRNGELLQLMMKSARAKAISHPIMELFGGFLLAAFLAYIFSSNKGFAIGPGFLTYLIAIQAFYDPIRRLTKINNEAQVARVSLDRIYAVLDRHSRVSKSLVSVPVPDQPKCLAFENVHFAYETKKGRNNQVLRNVTLEVHKGETVALVGGSGGGKTTLINLVPRFFDPTAGRVTLDGIDLREFDPRELRLRIGIVTQETLLFMDSVHDNIAYGKTVDRDTVVAAAKRAQAHEFIVALPKGYDTPLAETGSTLSGGQRQRLAIARALLHDPPILILDEATSALDTENERAVQEALEALMQDRTTLVIAHRISTIKRATRICVLNNGEIVESGCHEQLLAIKGEYNRLYQLQFRN